MNGKKSIALDLTSQGSWDDDGSADDDGDPYPPPSSQKILVAERKTRQ